MNTKHTLVFLQTLCALAIGLAASHAQTFTVLKSFLTKDGSNPSADLTLSGNTLYGTTYMGGAAITGDTPYGTVFKINTDGTGFTILKTFGLSEAHSPMCSLALSGNTLYGTTQNDGPSGFGTVFKINTDGTGYTVLKHFASTDGAHPMAGLTLSGSTLYGTTYMGGSLEYGTVFKINTDGSGFKVLKNFSLAPDGGGMNPNSCPTLSGNTLYGTTYNGGASSHGTAYKVNTDGTGFAVLMQFGMLDGNPYAGLTLSGSTLYGTTYNGGSSLFGTIFKINTDGSGYTVLRNLGLYDGGQPYAGLTLSGSTLYGTTSSGGSNFLGTIFQINTDGSGYTVLKNLAAMEGSRIYAGVLLSGSTLYGAAAYGGAGASGTIFSWTPGLAFPSITSQPESRTNLAGSTGSFQVTATPTNGLSYQWRKNTTSLVNGGLISGATSNVLTLANIQTWDAGNYSVVITNSSGSVTSSVAVLSVKGPPWALSDNVTVPLGVALTFPTSVMLANDRDPDGDSISIPAVQSPSALGVNVTLRDGMVTYWGSFTITNTRVDHFTYTLANMHGLASLGFVNVTLTGSLPDTNQIALTPLADGSARLMFSGHPTFRYALERANDVGPSATWEPLETNWAGAAGFVIFTNMPAPGTNNFYRAHQVPIFP